MHSVFLNIILQLIEGLISFHFYETIKPNNSKRWNAPLILSGYMVMCVINLIFNYNVVINTIILTLFQFLFALLIYRLKAVFSLLYAFLITSLVTITELSALEIVAIITNGNTRDFIENTYSYVIALVISKTLLFIALKILSFIISKFHYKEKDPHRIYLLCRRKSIFHMKWQLMPLLQYQLP